MDAEGSMSVCRKCDAVCCTNLASMIARPYTKSEVEDLRWHLHFDTVRVFIKNLRWYLLIKGRCIYLDKNNMCTIYDRRPKKCRDHNPPDCEGIGDGRYWDVIFSTPKDLDAYIKKENARRRKKRKKTARKK